MRRDGRGIGWTDGRSNSSRRSAGIHVKRLKKTQMNFLNYRYVQKLPVGLSKRRIWIANVLKDNGNLLDLRKVK